MATASSPTALGLQVPPPAVLTCNWAGSALKVENTLHQLSPYIGKLKSSIAGSLISQFTKTDDLIYDPFSGSGTVALEAWAAGRNVVANDLSPYAALLTRAKLFPPLSLQAALEDIEKVSGDADREKQEIDLRSVPAWVREFFHRETLREALAWTQVLRRRRRWFLLASLLGILHHQRPGLLSFPSSHTVPYLRLKAFPPANFPKLYEYRSLRDRLAAKVARAFRRVPELDYGLTRQCFSQSAHLLAPTTMADAIITSPPYMRQLDYARDNRLRLWFLGIDDPCALDKVISPRKDAFLKLMRQCFKRWKTVLKPQKYCILVVGDGSSEVQGANLPEIISGIATDEVGGYVHVYSHAEAIPNERRVRRGLTGSTSETVVVLCNNDLRAQPAAAGECVSE
ncbi:MAG: DNA methyltransferase [Bryobacteraceae bacterium]